MSQISHLDPETVFDDRVIYAQFIIGAPGAGKTTYCTAMHQFLRQLGREALLVDFDPAHEANVSPFISLSLSEFITVDQVMEQFKLGPNGALMYCMEWLEDHLDSIIKAKVAKLLTQNPNCRYILFDLPGQIELYSHSGSIQRILQAISGVKISNDDDWGASGSKYERNDDDDDQDDQKNENIPNDQKALTTTTKRTKPKKPSYTPLSSWNLRSVVVHLTDSVLCLEPHHYISSLLVSLSIMLNLQLPHVNVLSKVDLFGQRHAQEQEQQMREWEEFQIYQQLRDANTITAQSGQSGQIGVKNDQNVRNPQNRQKSIIDPSQFKPSHSNPFLSDIGMRGLSTKAPTPRLDFFDGNYLEAIANQIDRELLYTLDPHDDDLDGFSADEGDYYDDLEGSVSYSDGDGQDEGEKKQLGDDENDNNNDNIKSKSTQPSREVLRYLKSFSQINHGLVNLIEDFSLVELTHLSVNDKERMADVLKSIDRANGYTFQDIDLSTMQHNKLRDSIPMNNARKE